MCHAREFAMFDMNRHRHEYFYDMATMIEGVLPGSTL